jgi:hypothetical protein
VTGDRQGLACGLPARIGGCHEGARCPGTGVQAAVPGGHDQLRVANGQGAGEVHGVPAPKPVLAGQVPGMPRYRRGELDRTDRGPVLLSGVFRDSELAGVQVVIASGGRERGAHLRVCQPARQRGVAPVP